MLSRHKEFTEALRHYAGKNLDPVQEHSAMIHLMRLIGIRPPTEHEFSQLRHSGEVAKQNYMQRQESKMQNQNLPTPHSQQFTHQSINEMQYDNGMWKDESQRMQENHPTNQMRHSIAKMGL